MTTPSQANEHPLERLRAEAETAVPADIRRELDELSAQHFEVLASSDWGPGAEDTLRGSIGRQRKFGMELRIGLGEDGAGLPYRKTTPLAECRLPELLAEARVGREQLLLMLDEVLRAAQSRAIRVWCYGDEVAPPLYLLALRQRLRALDHLVAQQRQAGPGDQAKPE